MKDNEDLDFLHEVGKKFFERSKQDAPIAPADVIGFFKEALEGITTVKTIEIPVFLPVIIEQEEEGFYTARTF